MVWKLGKLQSVYNELWFYVEPYLTPCTSFVLGLLIFKWWLNDSTETFLLDDSFIILKHNVFTDRAPCTKLHKREQKDKTQTLAEFPDHLSILTMVQHSKHTKYVQHNKAFKFQQRLDFKRYTFCVQSVPKKATHIATQISHSNYLPCVEYLEFYANW